LGLAIAAVFQKFKLDGFAKTEFIATKTRRHQEKNNKIKALNLVSWCLGGNLRFFANASNFSMEIVVGRSKDSSESVPESGESGFMSSAVREKG
jgi:hypothetical protein